MPSVECGLGLPTHQDRDMRTWTVQPAEKEGQPPRCSRVLGTRPLPTGAGPGRDPRQALSLCMQGGLHPIPSPLWRSGPSLASLWGPDWHLLSRQQPSPLPSASSPIVCRGGRCGILPGPLRQQGFQEHRDGVVARWPWTNPLLTLGSGPHLCTGPGVGRTQGFLTLTDTVTLFRLPIRLLSLGHTPDL